MLTRQSSSSSSAPSRFITAFPNGNTGTLVYFVPVGGNGSTPLGSTLQNGSLTSHQADFNQTGLQGVFEVSADLEFGVTISEGWGHLPCRSALIVATSWRNPNSPRLCRVWRQSHKLDLQLHSRSLQLVICAARAELDQWHNRPIPYF